MTEEQKQYQESLQGAIDLAHEVREALPFLCVYVNEGVKWSSVWISNEAKGEWWKCKEVTSVSSVPQLVKFARIFNVAF